MQTLQDLIQRRMNEHHLAPAAQAAVVVHLANDYFSKLGRHPLEIRAISLKQAILWVEVANSIFAQEVQGAALELLQIFQQKYPYIKVTQLRTKTLTTL